MQSTTAPSTPYKVSDPAGPARPDEIELARRELDGRVEVTALYDVTAHADRADPGIVAREAAGAALVFALGAEPSPEHLAEVEVLGGRGDPPELHVTGELAVLLAGREVHVSLSHEGSLAAALVVLSPRAI